MKSKKHRLIILFLPVLLFAACSRDESYQLYYPLKNDAWHRFNILKFEIPITRENTNMNVYFFAEVTRSYSFDNLDFNMVMNTPSGEERINTFQIRVKSGSGDFSGNFRGDSCRYELLLKEGLYSSKKGTLTIEIENLNPRIETTGISGVGIRITPSGK